VRFRALNISQRAAVRAIALEGGKKLLRDFAMQSRGWLRTF
jgi:hypothetical protein